MAEGTEVIDFTIHLRPAVSHFVRVLDGHRILYLIHLTNNISSFDSKQLANSDVCYTQGIIHSKHQLLSGR